MIDKINLLNYLKDDFKKYLFNKVENNYKKEIEKSFDDLFKKIRKEKTSKKEEKNLKQMLINCKFNCENCNWKKEECEEFSTNIYDRLIAENEAINLILQINRNKRGKNE